MSSGELQPIVLYDIPCTTKGRPWSPNTMKTRYCLGYAGLLQSKGITQPPYTLPAIEDPNTGAFVMESLAIATYLDEKYPETPAVLSPAARVPLEKAEEIFTFGSRGGAGADEKQKVAPDAALLVFVVLGAEQLNPVSKAYYHHTRAARSGERWATMVDACSTGPENRAEKVQQGVEAMKEIFRKAAALYHRQGSLEGESDGPFVLGKEPCLFDFMVAGRVKFVLDVLTASEAEVLKSLDGGRLTHLVENIETYYTY